MLAAGPFLHADDRHRPPSGLQDLYLLAGECDIAWTVVGQAAFGARDDELLAVVRRCEGETAIQLKWLCTRMKAAAPQALVVAD